MGKIKAVLFDMDGLMIDSEPLSLQAFNMVFRKYGKYLTEDESNKRYVGISDKDASQDMIKRFDLPMSAEELVLAKKDAYQQILKTHQIISQVGLFEILTNLHSSGYKIGIASGSSLKEIEIVINGLQISQLVDIYCSADEVENGKPAPDVYLLAAKKLGVSPADCLVLEDAPKGVQAAKSAGMICFAIPSNETKGLDFSQADKVLNSLAEVFNLL